MQYGKVYIASYDKKFEIRTLKIINKKVYKQ